MEATLFDELVASLHEAKAIIQGELPPSRRFELKRIDVKAIREKTGLSQSQFAHLIQISTKTLQNWEQQRRTPTGPAAALLKIVAVNPSSAIQALQSP
ncbi:NadS family protein [uncultured Thiothrix sp.]|jgi:DNA-binding transcriptional regulator YiaG|uniref:NadS family protein n=1 Tax=uncultured Thiothrix sp. TaxID=223185 RepID=UPI00262898E2|nr:NadS family protein [uncultured Thiothrix sp.]HMT95029.1 NadS family protein [Thiolinea sp.]